MSLQQQKTIGTISFAQETRLGAALPSINNLGLVPTKHRTASSGVPPSQHWITGVTGGVQKPYKGEHRRPQAGGKALKKNTVWKAWRGRMCWWESCCGGVGGGRSCCEQQTERNHRSKALDASGKLPVVA